MILALWASKTGTGLAHSMGPVQVTTYPAYWCLLGTFEGRGPQTSHVFAEDPPSPADRLTLAPARLNCQLYVHRSFQLLGTIMHPSN